MRRYWVPKESIQGEQVLLEGDLFHHIFDVCRQEQGSKFEILSEGRAYFVVVETVLKKSASAKILETRILPSLQKPFVHLCVSLPKLPTFDLIIEKAVELGVQTVHPFVSDFSFIRDVKSEKLKNKKERWDKIIKAATQQSGRGDLMQIEPLITLESLMLKMNQSASPMGLFPYEGSSDQTVKSSILEMKGGCPENVWIFVGSEGGFSDVEVKFFKDQGLKSSTLGDQVLRVETACLALVSIVKYEFSAATLS